MAYSREFYFLTSKYLHEIQMDQTNGIANAHGKILLRFPTNRLLYLTKVTRQDIVTAE